MKGQIKSTLIQIAVGATVVIVGLMALNKFVPTFTLFPKVSETTEQEEAEQVIPDMEEDVPVDEPQEDEMSDLELEEEEATSPKTSIPNITKSNIAYSGDKRLKANNLGFFKPRELMSYAKTKITTNFYNEFCEEKIPSYQKKIKLYFSLRTEELSDAILFFAVKTPRKTYYFKPRGTENLLKIPNDLPNGRHQLEYGYVLKNEVNKRKIFFYSRTFQVTVGD